MDEAFLLNHSYNDLLSKLLFVPKDQYKLLNFSTFWNVLEKLM